MLAYLINPKLQRLHDVELPTAVDGANMLKRMCQLIGAESLDHQMISDECDQLWSDDRVFDRGDPCFAFRLRGHGADMGPFGGICIIIGNDRQGRSRPPFVPLDMIANDIDWLGEILPEVTWIQEVDRAGIVRVHAIVTYKRAS
jgi:hypothetical protein